MDFNKFVFPAPTSSYTPFSLDQLIWIPRTRFFSMKSIVKKMASFDEFYLNSRNSARTDGSPRETQTQEKHLSIPCHYQTYGEGHKHLIIYFHGNAEDIGYASSFTRSLALGLKADVLSVEYPGYGVYEGQPNSKTIIEDAEIVFDFLTAEAGVEPQNIIVFGRSIGSGPATHLAAHRNPGALVLMSPYTSLKAAVKDIAGPLLCTLFAERFNNIEEIEKVECPCFFLHGKKDKIIPWEHSRALFVKCKAATSINLSETMSHNTFKLGSDIVQPTKKFIRQIGFKELKGKIEFPEYVTRVPRRKYSTTTQDTTARLLYENVICEI